MLNTLVQLDPIYVTFNPSETDLAAIQKARAAGKVAARRACRPATATPSHKGKLTFLDNAVDRSTGTIIARATIANADVALLPGQYVRVRLHVGEEPDALMVPQAALGSSQLGKFVYVVGEDSEVELRLVTLGRTDGELVAILSAASPKAIRSSPATCRRSAPACPCSRWKARPRPPTQTAWLDDASSHARWRSLRPVPRPEVLVAGLFGPVRLSLTSLDQK